MTTLRKPDHLPMASFSLLCIFQPIHSEYDPRTLRTTKYDPKPHSLGFWTGQLNHAYPVEARSPEQPTSRSHTKCCHLLLDCLHHGLSTKCPPRQTQHQVPSTKDQHKVPYTTDSAQRALHHRLSTKCPPPQAQHKVPSTADYAARAKVSELGR
jgi:hypothetical protein